jgi:hypothetical protein
MNARDHRVVVGCWSQDRVLPMKLAVRARDQPAAVLGRVASRQGASTCSTVDLSYGRDTAPRSERRQHKFPPRFHAGTMVGALAAGDK